MTCLSCNSPGTTSRPIHVLFVDDDLKQREMYQRRLERRNLKVQVAGDGNGALRLVRAERPDVVVLVMSVYCCKSEAAWVILG